MSSVYFWDLDDGFAGVVLMKKSEIVSDDCVRDMLADETWDGAAVSPTGKSAGAWDSIHVFEAVDRARTAHYKLTSTVILHLSTRADTLGEMELSGNMTRQIEQDLPIDDENSHIVNIGRVGHSHPSQTRWGFFTH